MNSLGVIRRLAVGVGAGASVGLMWATGRRNPSVLLLAMFAVWVLVPYAVMLVVDRRSDSQAASVQLPLTLAAILLAATSIGIYGFVFVSSPAKAAAPFLILPIAQLLIVAATTFVGRRKSRG